MNLSIYDTENITSEEWREKFMSFMLIMESKLLRLFFALIVSIEKGYHVRHTWHLLAVSFDGSFFGAVYGK